MTDRRPDLFSTLLARAKSGDENAKRELFARLGEHSEEGAKLLELVRQTLLPGDRVRRLVDSQDLVQTSLRSAWIDLEGFRGDTEEQFLAWFRRIVQHKVYGVARRRDATLLLDGQDRRTPPDADARDVPLEQLIQGERRSRLKEAIRELPEEQRQVIKLRLKGLQAPEIGELLDLKPATVRKRESRAVARLKKALGEGD